MAGKTQRETSRLEILSEERPEVDMACGKGETKTETKLIGKLGVHHLKRTGENYSLDDNTENTCVKGPTIYCSGERTLRPLSAKNKLTGGKFKLMKKGDYVRTNHKGNMLDTPRAT